MTDDSVQKQVDQQNDENYQDDSYAGSGGGAEPMVIDDAMEQAFGEQPHMKSSVNIADKIEEDEANRGGGAYGPEETGEDEE